MTTIAAESVRQELESRGLKSNYNVSETDYGVSAYFYFYYGDQTLKVRISDHDATNRDRIANEYMIDATRCDAVKVVNNIERLIYPERFEFIPCSMKEGATHRINNEFGRFVRK